MGGEVKQVTFSEGVSTSSPTPQTTSIANLVVFASTTAFLADKGTAVEHGDCFLNSSDTKVYLYDSVKWRSIITDPIYGIRSDSTDVTLTSDDLIMIGDASSGDYDYNLLAISENTGFEVSFINSQNTGLMNLIPSGSETINGDSSTVIYPGQKASFRAFDKDYVLITKVGNPYQTKKLSGTFNSNQDLNDLQFNNLVIGKTYEAHLYFEATFNAAGADCQINMYSQQAGLGTHYGGLGENTATDMTLTSAKRGGSFIFTAATTTVYSRLTVAGATGATSGTRLTIEQRDDLTPVTLWN